MASTQSNSKKMEYKKVSFDVTELPPDAPAGEWTAQIPRGKCKVQPTKEEKLPMIIVPFRLEATEEDGEEFEKALGTELSTFLVFGGKTPKGERMAKLRIREVCEACDVDLDIIPTELEDPETDLEPLIKALEGKKIKVWTVLQTRRDTGEVTTELKFRDPKGLLSAPKDGDDDDDDDDADDKPKAKAKASKDKPKSKSKR